MRDSSLSLSTPFYQGVSLFVYAFLCLAFVSCTEDSPTIPPDNTPDETCTPGALECPCDDEGACDEGRCADGLCIACPEGTLRCPCGADQSCSGDLVCEDEVCEEPGCDAGTLGCPCDDEGACGEGLLCMDNSCVEDTCPAGSLDCPCQEGACSDDLVCMNEVCRVCEPDTAGCPCDDEGACGENLVCEQGACRDEVLCQALSCAPEQLCQEAADGADAQCLEACSEGFVWDAVNANCQPEVILPTCAPDAPESIAVRCTEEQRLCVEDLVQGASCGACVEGFLEEEGACRALVTCPELACDAGGRACVAGEPGMDAVCGDCLDGYLLEGDLCVVDMRATCSEDAEDVYSILADCEAQGRFCMPGDQGASCGECTEGLVEDPRTEQCMPLDSFGACETQQECPDPLRCIAREAGGRARCLPVPCDDEESLDLRLQVCTDRCDCEGPGLTGASWPVTDWNGDCVCETEPGYFFNVSSARRSAELCDADNDGWTRRNAFVHVNDPDEAVRINARCDIRAIGQIRLVNEFGQQLDVSMAQLTGGLAEVEELYETNESDDPTRELERYGQRQLEAAELNPLTRACVSERADFNDNGVSDLREDHRSFPIPEKAWMTSFVAASYLVELHTGHYQAPADGQAYGTYVIAERSRCDEDFPVGYNTLDGDYWTSCSRRRTEAFSRDEPFGFDFQAWNCDDRSGRCPRLEPPSLVAEPGQIPAHGLCEARLGEDPEAWRGMNHASQFRCAQIIGNLEPEQEPWQVRRADLYGEFSLEGSYHLNQCSLVVCADDDPDCVATQTQGEGANASSPSLVCESEASVTMANPQELLSQVRLMAVRYKEYGDPADYPGGCINEWAEWPQLCPGYDPRTTVGQGNVNDFGELACGCDYNYGGAACDVGCPTSQLHYGGTNLDSEGFCNEGYCITRAESEGRSGYWMCGDFAATSYTNFTEEAGAALVGSGSLQVGDQVLEGSFTVRGRIPIAGTDGTPMFQVDEEGNQTGYIVR